MSDAIDSSAPLDIFRLPDATLTADLAPLRQPWVRDIAWLLHAPDMAAIGYPGRPSLGELGLDDTERRRAWLEQQEHQSALFDARHEARRSNRLGIYHETLWQWVFEQAPGTRLIAHNVTLRENRQTLGELDLLYATRLPSSPSAAAAGYSRVNHGCINHAELAIKFFLGLPDGPGDEHDAARWIGIGSFDSLAIKCHRLQSHQLPKGLSIAALERRETLDADGPLTQRIIMPGFLYHPWDRRLALPTLANTQALQGLWCHHRDWGALLGALPEATTGHEWIKPGWLAPPMESAMSVPDLTGRLEAHFIESGRPRHLSLSLPDGRACRVFVVRDDWPPALPLPPKAASPSTR